MTTPRMLTIAYAALIPLGLGGGRPVVLAVLCGAVLLIIGDLWLRALPGETIAALARIGLATVAGLVTLPGIAITLHVSGRPIRTGSLTVGLAVLVTVLGTVALLRERAARPLTDPRLGRVAAAITIPAVVMLGMAATAVEVYDRLPRPPQPGYTSVALNGWAAHLTKPVVIPPQGLVVPIRVSSAGVPAADVPLRVRVGDRVSPPRAVPITPGTTRSVEVHVPAPPDGCLHRIEISLAGASTVFYGQRPALPATARSKPC